MKPSSRTLSRDGVLLAYEHAGTGDPPIVLVHGSACHRGRADVIPALVAGLRGTDPARVLPSSSPAS